MKKAYLTFTALMLCSVTSSQIFATSYEEEQPQISITHPALTKIEDEITRMCVFSILQPHHATHLEGIAQGLAQIEDEDVRIQVASLLTSEILAHIDNVEAQNLIATLATLPNQEERAQIIALLTPEITKAYAHYLPNLVMHMARLQNQDQRATFALLAEESLENAMHYAQTGFVMRRGYAPRTVETYGPREFGW